MFKKYPFKAFLSLICFSTRTNKSMIKDLLLNPAPPLPLQQRLGEKLELDKQRKKVVPF